MLRRDFVRNLAATATAGSMLASGFAPSTLAIDPIVRPQGSQLRLSLAAYSFRQYLTAKSDDPKKMDLFQFVDFCHKHGLDGAELTSYYFPSMIDDQYLYNLKRHCHVAGVAISGGAIRNDFCQKDPAKVEADLKHTLMWIDHYAKLGATAIRIFAGNPVADEELEITLARCASVTTSASEYAAMRGVMLALENHGGVTATAEGLLKIVKQVDSRGFGVNFDSGNFRSTDDPYTELAMIAPYAVNAQIKVEIVRGGKKEEADLARIVNILRSADYSGWVALEYEAEEEPLEAVPRWLDRIRPLLEG